MLTQEEQCEWRERGCAEGWQGEKGKGEGKEDEFSGGDSAQELQLSPQCPPDMFKDRKTSAKK